MLDVKFNFKCPLCNDIDFYVMPLKKKVGTDFINSETEFNLQCKKCGKNYILTLGIKAI